MSKFRLIYFKQADLDDLGDSVRYLFKTDKNYVVSNLGKELRDIPCTVTSDKVFKDESFISKNGKDIGTFTIDEELNEEETLISKIRNNLASKVTGIVPNGTVIIKENGLYDITDKEKVSVEIDKTSDNLPTQEKFIEITDVGETEILPDDGYVLSRVIANVNIEIPETPIQEKSIEITSMGETEILPDEGYLLSKVSVDVEIPTQEKTVDITENGTVEVTADEGHLLSKVTANVNVASSGGESGNNDFLVSLIEGTLTEIKAEDLKNVTQLGEYAFAQRKNISRVTIPGHIKSMDRYAFYSNTALREVVLLEGFETIGPNAFNSNTTGLNKLTLPSSLKQIKENAFQNTPIKEVHISDLDKWFNVLLGASLSNFSFDSCPFRGSTILYVNGVVPTEIEVPESVTKLNGYILCNLKQMTKITFHNAVTSIETGALYQSGLISVKIPDSVTTISNGVFAYCYSLTDVEIGSGIKTISQNAFQNCTAMESITINAETPPTIQSGTFKNVPETCPIYVPAASVEAYRAKTNFSARADYIFAKQEG